MKTTKQLVDEEWERQYILEKGFIEAEREHWEQLEMEAIMKDEKKAAKYAKVFLGRARKARKFEPYARVFIKVPRFIRNIQHK